MDYQKIYDNLMIKAKSENRVKNKTIYYELHHIKPFFLYNTSTRKRRPINGEMMEDLNHVDNTVLLTFKEHVFAHVLLCKIYENSKYEYGAIGSINVMLQLKGKTQRKSEYLKCGKVFNRVKSLQAKRLSVIRTNTICVKERDSGKMIGFVSKDDPKYISGEYIFYQKGIKRSQEFKDKQSKKGFENSNRSDYTDLMLEESFLDCVSDVGFIPSKNIWIEWSFVNKKPHLKYIKDFRFNGKGFNHLYNIAEQKTGMKYDPYFTRQIENIKYIEEIKHKWGK